MDNSGPSPVSGYPRTNGAGSRDSGAPNPVTPQPLEVSDALTGETIFLGANSAPACFLRLSPKERSAQIHNGTLTQTLMKGNVLSLFGLDNSSVTYPFVNLWSTNDISSDDASSLHQALPSDLEILKAFRQYRSTSYLYYPSILELDGFEVEIYSFLSQREANSRNDPQQTASLHGKGFAWIGSLYAMLAAAAQFNDTSVEERSLASRVFVCLSFQCLRLTNFFQRPSIQSIQTMLLIGNVLQNDRNPGIAWTLLGMTIRSAQSIGLHHVLVNSQTLETESKRRLWCAVVWQDMILSISHDRPTICAHAVTSRIGPSNNSIESSLDRFNTISDFSYEDCLSRLCPIIHNILSSRTSMPKISSQLSSMESLCDALNQVQDKAKPNLQLQGMCMTRPEYGEHLALQFTLAYAKSELCRPAVELEPDEVQSENWARVEGLQRVFTGSAWDTIHIFLDIREFDPKLVRTWAAMHRVLSAALVLGVLAPEKGWMDSNQRRGRGDPLERLIPVLEKMEAEISLVSGDGHGQERSALGKSVEILNALTRAC